MKKNYLLFFLLLILNNSYSQCPSGQFGITNPSFEGPVGAHITPSPWSTCGVTPDTQPGYWGINLAPSDGSSYVGLVNGGPSWLEGVSQTLSSSLLAGFTYNLTIDLAMGNSNQGGVQPAPTRIKIYGGNAVCQKTQLLWTSPTISHVTWQKYNIILAPNQNFTSIYIVIDETSPPNSYMLIDNIRQLPTSVASVISNITCKGGTGGINLTTSDGMPPYIFNWNDGVTTEDRTGLAAGTYTVTVTDANGCISTKSFTITEPDVININLKETSFNSCSTCNDSSLLATITGGTAPYTYNWNDGATTKDRIDLLNGTYTLTVTDAEGCTLSKNIVVSTKVELPYKDFTYTNGNAVSELNNFTTCQSGAVVKASSGRYTSGVWYDGSYELFVNNISLGVFTGEKTIDISNYIPITSVKAVGNHNFWSWTAVEVKTYSEPADVPPTSPTVSNVYYQLNSTAVPLTATLNGVGTTLKWYTDELGSDYSAVAPTPLTNQLGTTSYYVSQANAVGCESARAKVDVMVVSPLTYTYQINNLLCYTSTGSIDLSVSGGTGFYTYLWSNGAVTEDITISQGGNYTCTVTDVNSGFSITTQVLQVLQPLQLKATITPKNVTCFGEENGEATVTATDGTAPYTYSWNDADNQTTQTATGLVPGTYEVTVSDANGCIITETVVITEPDVLDSVPTQVNVLCHGNTTGSATAAISGGVAPYTYVWNHGITSTTNEVTNLSAGTYEVTVTDANGCIIKQIFTITEPSALNSTPSQADVLCHGNATGSATAVISGGVAPYTYVWNNGIATTANEATNLSAGTYEVTATDANGCIITESFTISEPSALNSTPSQVDVLCNGESTGSASITISGGVAPYTYVWNNGITSTTNEVTNLSAGTYEVTVTDANGCIIKQSFTITEPSALNSVPSQVDVLCHGNATGSAIAAISDGVAPYTYVWNNGITSTTNEATNLSASTYEVTVTDANGCIIKQIFTITEPSALNSTPSQADVLCNGESTGSASITISGGVVPYTYVWNNGITSTTNEATNLSAGTYEITVTDANGCIIKQSFTITEPPLVLAPLSHNQEFCIDDNPTVSNLTATGTLVKWYSSLISSTPLQESELLTNGTYFATQTINGCESPGRTTVNVTVYDLNSVDSSSVTICLGTSVGQIILENFTAQQLKWYRNINDVNEISDNSIIGSGTYYISNFNGICESPRTPIFVNVIQQLQMPVAAAHSFCENAYVSQLVVTGAIEGAEYVWYANASTNIPLQPSAALQNGTYFVTQKILNCESARRAVTVKVTLLTAPQTTSFQLCENATVADLVMPTPSGITYNWYLPNQATPLNQTTTLVTGNYFVSKSQNGCESAKTIVQVTINPRPASPTGISPQNFMNNGEMSDVVMDQPNIIWYVTYQDALNNHNPLESNRPLENNHVYYAVIIDHNDCPSLPTPITVTITLGIKDLDLAALKYYPNPTESELNVSYKEAIREIEVYDLLGKLITSEKFDLNDIKMNVSDLSAGTYIFRIKTDNGSQFVKIVKK